MKYILVDSKNVVGYIVNNVQDKTDRYFLVEENTEVFKDYSSEDIEGNITHNYITLYNLQVPENVEEQKYCYTPNDGFYENPNYVEPPKPVEERLDSAELSITEIELALTEIYEGGI